MGHHPLSRTQGWKGWTGEKLQPDITLSDMTYSDPNVFDWKPFTVVAGFDTEYEHERDGEGWHSGRKYEAEEGGEVYEHGFPVLENQLKYPLRGGGKDWDDIAFMWADRFTGL